MSDEKIKSTDERMIHIRLSGSVHRNLRIIAAEQDTSIQDFVSNIIEKEVTNRTNAKKENKNGT